MGLAGSTVMRCVSTTVAADKPRSTRSIANTDNKIVKMNGENFSIATFQARPHQRQCAHDDANAQKSAILL
jgi:hypothetical protein